MDATPSIAASRAYAAAQTVLLVIFAAILLWNPGDPLLRGEAWRLAGSVLGVAGLIVIAAGFGALGRNIQVAPHTKEGARLVQSGIYRVLRHSIYTGIAACVIGLWLRDSSIAAGIAALVVIAFLGVKRRVEERFLLAAYPEYAAYRTRTIAFP